ncbi:enolase-phosphatase E1 [Mugil cephalus]|uniref:enolase-phosphatase E1 n=1 Tax=Mugil cephalus TaxID=48193 RepID=UPI001FB64D3A|nr:enolase-phosphatase E1 [Mugil cephalus]
MMEFWQENQGQSHLYSNFGTVPGRNCTHNYHDRRQSAHYPLHCGEQLDQGKESSYWTLPGSRTAGAPHEFTNWKDQELSNTSSSCSSSSHFPFILDRNTQHHRDLGEYQPHEAKDREWTTAHRAARDYERGLREGWQRRWEPCSPVHYNRESCVKRSDSSYRELEAWAARYSHSLPRRRRIEAELRGASQGLVERSRSGMDPQVAALQHVRQSGNIRESGLWDRGVRQQAPTYYPSQNPDTSHMLDMKGNASYQRRTFSQPPGYIAPPPYNSPQKSMPLTHRSDTSYEQDVKKHTYWSQPTQINQDISEDLQDKRKVEKEVFTLPGENTTCIKSEGLKNQNQEASSPISVQNTTLQHELMQQPEEVKSSNIVKEISSNVIEGRKFRLKKKTGGMTIFCLVSRRAGATEASTLPLQASQTSSESTELGQVSEGLRDTGEASEMHEVADEVDFRTPTLKEQSKASDDTPTCTDKEMFQGNLSNKEETDVVFPEKVGQSASVKYPLWREPSFTSRADPESEEEEPVQNITSHPIDIEVRRLDIKEDTKDGNGLLVIDTTCVVVKMELIPSPKKEHVHYLGSTEHAEESPSDIQTTELNSDLNQDVTTDQKTDVTPLQTSLGTELVSLLLEKEEHEEESEISVPCMTLLPVPGGETLEERAERILGIPLHDCIPEHQPKNVTSVNDPHFEEEEEQKDEEEEQKDEEEEDEEHEEEQKEEKKDEEEEEEEQKNEEEEEEQKEEQKDEEEEEPSPINNYVHNTIKQNETEEATDEDQSQNHFEVVQTEVCLTGSDVSRDQGENEEVEGCAEISRDNDTDSQLEASMEIRDEPLLESTGENGTSEQEENLPVEDDSCNSSSLSHFTSPSFISDTDEGPDTDLASHDETSSLPPQTPLHQLASPLPLGSSDSSPSLSPPTDYSPSHPPHLDLRNGADEVMTSEVQDEEAETLQLPENETNNVPAATDMMEDMLSSQQQLECDQMNDTACVTDEGQTIEAEEDPALEQNPETYEEKAVDANIILHQQADCVPTEDTAGVEESNITEEQPPAEVSEDPRELSGHVSALDEENVTDSLTEDIILPQPFDCGQNEEAVCEKESGVTESQKDPDELPVDLWEQQMRCKINATDSQTETMEDTEPQSEPFNTFTPLTSDYELSPLDEHSLAEPPSPPHVPLESDTECVSPLDMDLACPSTLNPDSVAAVITESVPPPLFLNPCEEFLQFSSPPVFDSPSSSSPPLPPSSPPPPEENINLLPDFHPSADDKETSNYPKSLWDVVNRIRKHTAPDSENEEEDMSELWDPENVGEGLGCPDMVVDMNTEKIFFAEAEQQEVSKYNTEMGQIRYDKQLSADDDTLSCSSTSSHGSGDTVVVANENEDEEHDAPTESKTETEEFHKAEVELHCSGEVKDETRAENIIEKDETDISEHVQSEECPVEVAMGKTETENV